MKIVKMDVNATSGSVVLYLLNTGEVALQVDRIYVQNLTNTYLQAFSPGDLALQPSATTNITLNLALLDLQQPLIFKAVTLRGLITSLLYVPPNNQSSSPPSGGNYSYTQFNITGTKFWDPDFLGPEHGGNGTAIGSGPGGYLFLYLLFYQQQGGVPIAFTFNDQNGNYNFSNLNKGLYWILEEPIPMDPMPGWQWVPTTPTFWQNVTINSQSEVVNFTNILSQFAFSISGHIYLDDTGQGLPNWFVVAEGADGFHWATTDQNGFYSINNLTAGIYTVVEVLNSTQWVNEPGDPLQQVVTIINSSVGNVDFKDIPLGGGSAGPYTISGLVYNDSDYSGNLTAGDNGLPNWLVTINNGSAAIYGIATDASGDFSFQVGDGVYTVQEILLNGNWTANNGTSKIVTVSGASVGGVDFGNYYTPAGGQLFVSGHIFNDLNMNGVYDNGDLNLTWLVTLKDSAGNTVLEVNISNSQGIYVLNVPGPGTYTVVAASLSGWSFSTPSVYTVNVIAAPKFGVDFGLFRQTNPLINAFVYNDTNPYDGPYNSTVDLPLSGWLVKVNNATFSEIIPTDPTGHSVFSNLSPGVYNVSQLAVGGWSNTTNLIQTVNVTTTSANVFFGDTLTSNLKNYTISGMIFNDFNRDGVFDGIDAAYKTTQVTITLYFANGSVMATTKTVNGNYTFNNVPPGSYIVGAANITNYVFTNNTAYTYVNNNLQNVSVIVVNSNVFVLFGVYNNLTAPQYTISGHVFNDSTGTHIYNGSQAGLGGWTILLNPSNGATLNLTLPPYLSAVTKADGSYSFAGVATGNYTIIELVNPLWFNTTPRFLNINLINDTVVNFGDLLQGSGGNQTYSISGVVFNDTDRNGTYGAGDLPLNGWTVYLLDNLSQPINVATTNALGQYTFNNNLPGSYTVQEFLLANWVNDTPLSQPVTVTNANVVNINFGNFPVGATPIYSISGMKFNDTNDNSVFDGTDNPLPNWIFLLYNGVFNDTLTVNSTVSTNAGGIYTFTNLNPGTYSVVEVLPLGWANTTDRVQVVTITNASLVENYGNWIGTSGVNGTGNGTTYSLFGIVFNDLDHDGLPYNPLIDTPMQFPRNITLYDSSGLPIAVVASQANTGLYSFNGLPNGTYTLNLKPQAGWTNSSPDVVTVTIAGSSVRVDFGIYQVAVPPVYVIDGYVYNDSNQNMAFDSGESGLNQWSVFLYNGIYNGNTFPIRIAKTDITGFYSFGGLSNGTYTVIETLQSGWSNTTPRMQVVNIAGNSVLNVSFGNFFTLPTQTYTISGFKFEDFDHSGTYNSTVDNLLPNWVFYISDASGIPFATSTTDANGNYNFNGLLNGTYTVFENLLGGWTNSTPKSVVVTVAGSNVSLPFGNYPTGSPPGYSIFGYVFNDTNDNGFFDGSDSMWRGYTVSLLNSGGMTIANQATNASGYFDFKDTVNGNYFIQALPLAGYTNTTPIIYPITISGASSGPWPFGFFKVPPVQNYTISGKVFNDSTGSGVYIPGDLNLSGWAVILVDQFNSTTVTFTDAKGNYSFTATNGSWTVEVPPQQGWSNTSNWIVPVTISGSSQIANFGFNLTTQKPQYSISAFVFNDTNQNGIFDNGESPLSNWIINLTYPSGTFVWSFTNSTGWAEFDNLTAGNYTVQEIPQQMNYLNSTPSILDVPLTTSSATVSFGVYANVTLNIYSINGLAYNDSDRDGIYNSSFDSPLVNFPVLLIPSVGIPVATYTDSSGLYSFTNLGNGNYTVELIPNSGWVLTTPALQNVTIANASVSNVDFGAYFNWFNVNGFVFLDVNKDGTYQPGSDIPLSNFLVDLKGSSGDNNLTTDASGFYQYTNVPGGNYTLTVFISPQGWTNTSQTSFALNLNSSVSLNFGVVRNFTSSFISAYTAAQWSANIGGYLKNDFSTVYTGNVVQIGWIGPGFTVTFGNPNFPGSNMTNFLSCLLPPSVLIQSFVEPLQGPGGKFGSDVLALQLNVDYSNAKISTFNQIFSVLTIYNYDPVVNGMTVNQILNAANQVLGNNTAANPWQTANKAQDLANLDTLVAQLNLAFSTSDYTWANSHLF